MRASVWTSSCRIAPRARAARPSSAGDPRAAGGAAASSWHALLRPRGRAYATQAGESIRRAEERQQAVEADRPRPERGELNRSRDELEVVVRDRRAARATGGDAGARRSRACARRRATARLPSIAPERRSLCAERGRRRVSAPPRASRCRGLGPWSVPAEPRAVSTTVRVVANAFAAQRLHADRAPSWKATRSSVPARRAASRQSARRGSARKLRLVAGRRSRRSRTA